MALVIKVENLSKSYQLGVIGGKTLRDDVQRWLAKMRGRPNPLLKIGQADHASRAGEMIWALKDVSFEVQQGEVLGIIGRNGAGKSTLLKILSRVTAPTSGVVKVKGRIASLLEVGTGFHPELTGRENIYLNGSILGMRRWEIEKKLEEIVDFSGVEKFIDTPVKRYSSGMYVRLAFAVAAHLDPEILVVDEVLAVGDAEFQKKCLGKMGEVAQGGRTVLFVSHNMGAVRSLCSRAIWLVSGRSMSEGSVYEVTAKYLVSESSESSNNGEIKWKKLLESNNEVIQFTSIKLLDSNGKTSTSFNVESPIIIEVNYTVFKNIRGIRTYLEFSTDEDLIAFTTTDHNQQLDTLSPGIYSSICIIPGHLLNIGLYNIKIGMDMPGVKMVIPKQRIFQITTFGVPNHGSNYPEKWPGVVSPSVNWEVKRL